MSISRRTVLMPAVRAAPSMRASAVGGRQPERGRARRIQTGRLRGELVCGGYCEAEVETMRESLWKRR
ncbi:MAG: hypothetical protein J0L64_00950 [Acidobacteria bacterium]|nr:hypothetical protein [Acidobacteriota bacterium]